MIKNTNIQHVKNELTAKSKGCIITDPALYEHQRKQTIWRAYFYMIILASSCFFLGALWIMGVIANAR